VLSSILIAFEQIVTNDDILLNLQGFLMGDKYRLTPGFEADLVTRHPDAPLCEITSMTAESGKSRAWIITHWKLRDFPAYEWGVDPNDPSDSGRRGKKICLQTHPNTLAACVRNVDARTAAHWQENAAKLNAPRTGWTVPNSSSVESVKER
jgi:hypothetical protein